MNAVQLKRQKKAIRFVRWADRLCRRKSPAEAYAMARVILLLVIARNPIRI